MDGDLLDRAGVQLKVHPAADLFPRMSPAELTALADDIKLNRQKVPILLDHTGEWLLDGRHRLEACHLLGIEPWFENADEGADPYVEAISHNAKRRDLTSGQRAIAAAREWVRAEAEDRLLKPGQNARYENGSQKVGSLIEAPAQHFAKQLGTNSRYVEMARLILQVGPDDLAPQVFSGAKSITEMFAEAQKRRDDATSEENRLARLQAEAPDIAKIVIEGTISLAAGEAELTERQRVEQAKRDTLLRVTESAFRGTTAWAIEEFADDVRARIDDPEFRTALIERLRLDGDLQHQLRKLSDGAAALSAILGELLP